MDRTRFLLRTAAIYAVIGVFIGSHMAGAGSYALRPIHAHILLVGWLSLFAFSMVYKVFSIPKDSMLAKVQVWSAFLGALGLTIGMWLHFLNNNPALETFNLVLYIVGGSILALSFVLFMIMTFVHGRFISEDE